MIAFLRDIVLAAASVFLVLLAGGVIVYTLTALNVGPEYRQSATEVSFRAACAEVKGHAVWNGRNWECIK